MRIDTGEYSGDSCLSHEPFCLDKVIPLIPVISIRNNAPQHWRSQIPINICYAITAYKSQGLQFNSSCAFDLGRYELCAGTTYVQLRRCSDVRNLIWRSLNLDNYTKNRWNMVQKPKMGQMPYAVKEMAHQYIYKTSIDASYTFPIYIDIAILEI